MNKPYKTTLYIYYIPGDIPYNFIAYRMVSHKNTYSMPRRRLALGGRSAASVESSLLRRGEPWRWYPGSQKQILTLVIGVGRLPSGNLT